MPTSVSHLPSGLMIQQWYKNRIQYDLRRTIHFNEQGMSNEPDGHLLVLDGFLEFLLKGIKELFPGERIRGWQNRSHIACSFCLLIVCLIFEWLDKWFPLHQF